MNKVATMFRRVRLYLDRAERDIAQGDLNGARTNVAEASEIARRLYLALSHPASIT